MSDHRYEQYEVFEGLSHHTANVLWGHGIRTKEKLTELLKTDRLPKLNGLGKKGKTEMMEYMGIPKRVPIEQIENSIKFLKKHGYSVRKDRVSIWEQRAVAGEKILPLL